MKENRILEAFGEKMPRAPHLTEYLLTARLEPADGIAKRALHLSCHVHDEMQMIGHNLAGERPNLRRKFGESLKQRANRRTEGRVVDMGLHVFRRELPPRIHQGNPFTPGKVFRPGGESRPRSYHNLAQGRCGTIDAGDGDLVDPRLAIIPTR